MNPRFSMNGQIPRTDFSMHTDSARGVVGRVVNSRDVVAPVIDQGVATVVRKVRELVVGVADLNTKVSQTHRSVQRVGVKVGKLEGSSRTFSVVLVVMVLVVVCALGSVGVAQGQGTASIATPANLTRSSTTGIETTDLAQPSDWASWGGSDQALHLSAERKAVIHQGFLVWGRIDSLAWRPVPPQGMGLWMRTATATEAMAI